MYLLFPVVLAAAIFVGVSGASLPPIVAAHFSAGGAGNGFMPRDAYLGTMVALVVGLPLLIGMLAALASRLPVRFISLPDRDYWLAPERSEETRAFLRRHGSYFAVVLAVVLCFIHGLVVAGNGQSPARFPETSLYAGAAAFVFVLAAWTRAFLAHFRR
ncbi:MAG: hypothetical protein HZA64_09895 [Rhodocyclales bacterium]|nr:hypothetical protein [Rhodocyclales bacterium]